MLTKIKKWFWNFFSFLWKKKWRWILIICLLCWLAYRIYSHYFQKEDDTSFFSNDYEVTTWDVSNSLSLIWTTSFANAQKLTFVNKWRVTSVKTKVWAEVKKWDVLATITTDDLDREVETTRKNLKNQQLKLNKILDKSNKDLDIMKAQTNYDLLVFQKETLPSEQLLALQTKKSWIQDLERQIKDKEKDLREAKNDYSELLTWRAWATHAELTIWKNVRDRNNSIEKLVRDFRESATNLKLTLDDYDKLMKMTTMYEWEKENVYIWAKDQSLLSNSKSQFWVINGYVSKLDDLYSKFNAKTLWQITEDELLQAYWIFKELWDEMVKWWRTNYDMFLESIESEWSLTRSEIDWYAKTFWTTIESQGYQYHDKYTSAVDTLASIKTSDTTVEDAADKVEKLSIELDTLKINLQKSNNELWLLKQQQALEAAELDKKIKDAEVDLAKAKEWNAQQDEIDEIRNEIDNTQFQISTLMKKYDEYKIIANFDWVVTKLDMQVWDSIETSNVSSADQKYIYVETPELLEVNLDIDQVDIVKVDTWMPVQVYLDAFPDQVYEGIFSEIDTMPENGSDFWSNGSYKAKVVFQKHDESERILWWMSASIKVVLNEEKDVLVVPNPAIVDNDRWEKVVRLKKSETEWVDQVVEIGLSDDVNTVILSWLKAWDIIKGLYITDDAIANAWITDEEEFW